jgi:hypothetical protein
MAAALFQMKMVPMLLSILQNHVLVYLVLCGVRLSLITITHDIDIEHIYHNIENKIIKSPKMCVPYGISF